MKIRHQYRKQNKKIIIVKAFEIKQQGFIYFIFYLLFQINQLQIINKLQVSKLIKKSFKKASQQNIKHKSFDILSFISQNNQMLNQLGSLIPNFQQIIQTTTHFDDFRIIPHLAKVLDLLNKQNIQNPTLVQLSNIVKQTQVHTNDHIQNSHTKSNLKQRLILDGKRYSFELKTFSKQAQKLYLAGISLGQNFNQQIHKQLVRLADQKHLTQVRFWGKILGTSKNYYIIQGYRPVQKQHLNVSLGSQKPAEGVNYYTYFATNDIFSQVWQELPQITVQHIRTARKIKKHFTGDLNNQINSYPTFPGLEKHYLKAQLARMTHSLQLAPKGIYKVNDQNPKVTEYEEEVKIPDFSELSTLEGWVHKNQMILNLGRCTHFVDPSLPEDQLQAAASQLAEKDPQIERLRGITEDKPVQPVEGGPQSYWIQKIVGNNQVFPKDQAQNNYAVSALRNMLWPGWITIGYMNGYSNFYLGNGLKSSQPAWSTLSNQNLQLQGIQISQVSEPNPKQAPKIESVPVQQNQQNVQQGGD